ncbi:MAG: caspase family protein [Candidatus Thermoplasmatota archaeon]|nr:caspase family protein [Candidatus Thermoplasmatota archaeon]
MKKTVVVLALSVLLLQSFIHVSIASENEIDVSNDVEYYAVIVGVERFQYYGTNETDERIDEDALAIYEKLNGSINWNEENIKLLLNENATKADIQDAIVNWLDGKEDENDVALYYFSGHSWKTPIPNRLEGHAYSIPYDVSDRYYSDDKITDVELDSWLDTLESKNVVVILDTCFSGRMKSLHQKGRTVLAAGGKYLFCPVDEDKDIGHGIFTYFLLQGFDGVADLNNDGWVTAREAFRYARLPTFCFSIWKQFPYVLKTVHGVSFIGPQIPYITNRQIGDIPLIQYCLVIK